jgi:glycosyltransferase involved in cell wall biosynthesis
VERLGLEESVKFCRGVPLHEMAQLIANADLGVVPKRADSFGNEAFSTKIMEFMSQGVPVVVSRTKIDNFYFEEGVVHFFRSGDSEEMAKAMLDVIKDQDLRESLVKRGYEYVERNGWARKKREYLDLIDSLSMERFEDIDPALSRVLPFRNQTERLCGNVAVEAADSTAVNLDDNATANSLHENVTSV